jgi:hypothetical protein
LPLSRVNHPPREFHFFAGKVADALREQGGLKYHGGDSRSQLQGISMSVEFVHTAIALVYLLVWAVIGQASKRHTPEIADVSPSRPLDRAA